MVFLGKSSIRGEINIGAKIRTEQGFKSENKINLKIVPQNTVLVKTKKTYSFFKRSKILNIKV